LHTLPYKLRRLEFPIIAFNSTQHVQMLVENEERLLDFESNHLIPWDHWPAKTDPYQPDCVSTQSQVEEARSEATWIGTFYHSQARSALVPGSSGDGQDPDDNRGPPGRQLPQDKVGGGNDSDEEEEERRKKKKKKEEESRLVRVTKIVVRNSNQVSTFNFFSSLFLAARSGALTGRLDFCLLFLAGKRFKGEKKICLPGSRCSLDEPAAGDGGQLRQPQQQSLPSEGDRSKPSRLQPRHQR